MVPSGGGGGGMGVVIRIPWLKIVCARGRAQLRDATVWVWVCGCVCARVCVCVPKALLPKGNGRDALITGKAMRLGPEANLKTMPPCPAVVLGTCPVQTWRHC